MNQQPKNSGACGKFEQEIHLEGGGVVEMSVSYCVTTPRQTFQVTSAIESMNNTLIATIGGLNPMQVMRLKGCPRCNNFETIPLANYCKICGSKLLQA